MKVLVWNLENLFLVPHLKSSYNQPLKPQKKVNQIISIINELDPDVLFLCEVGGDDSLKKLESSLDDDYFTFYTEGNSDRGIGLGFLVRKTYSHTKFFRHTDVILPAISVEDRNSPRKFSRDLAELWLTPKDVKSPNLIIFGVHLKSAQDRTGADHRGFRQRSAEVRGLVTIIKQRQIQFPDVPIWFVGDFNGLAAGDQIDPEFEHLHAQLPAHQDLLTRLDTPKQQRWTFAMSFQQDKSLPSQLDYFFIPPSTPTPEHNNSGVVQLWQRLGNNAGPAKTAFERDLWPSDHLPLLATWDKDPF